MSFFGRIHRVINGVGGALQAPLGLVKDVALAPFSDDNHTDGFLSSFGNRLSNAGGAVVDRGAQELRGDQALLSPAANLGKDAFTAVGTIYNEGVQKPFIAANEAISKSGNAYKDVGGVSGVWARVRHIPDFYDTKNTTSHSIGDSIWLNSVKTTDLNDKAAVDKARSGWQAKVATVGLDVVVGGEVDPLVLGGKAIQGARAANEIRSVDDILRLSESGQVDHVANQMEGKSAAQIKDEFFSRRGHSAATGVPASAALSAADSSTRPYVLRRLMGDARAEAVLRQADPELSSQVDRLLLDDSQYMYPESQPIHDPAQNHLVTGERDAILSTDERLNKAEALFNKTDPSLTGGSLLSSLPQQDAYQAAQNARKALSGWRSEIYQKNPLSRIIHIAADPLPERIIDVGNRTAANENFTRFLNQADLPTAAADDLRSRMMTATSPQDRLSIWAEGEEKAVSHLATNNGMTTEEVDAVLAKAKESRGGAIDFLRKGVNTPKDTYNFSFVDESGVLHDNHVPIPSDPTNLFPVVDLKEVRKATSSIGQFKLEHPGVNLAANMTTGTLDNMTGLWKSSVLLRLGYPLKIAGVDEQLRLMSIMGVGDYLKQTVRGTIPQVVRNGVDRISDVVQRVPKNEREFRPLGSVAPNLPPDYAIEHSVGMPADVKKAFQDANTSRDLWSEFGPGKYRDKALSDGYQTVDDWRSVHPQDAGYGTAWENIVNKDIGSNPIAKQLIGGKSTEEVTNWLKETPEGQIFASKNRIKAVDPASWVEETDAVIHQHLPTPELQTKALAGTAKIADLEAALPEVAQRPNVHQEIVKTVTGGSKLSDWTAQMQEKALNALGAVPTDTFSRGPLADFFYRTEFERRANIAHEFAQKEGRLLGQSELDAISNSSREYATGKMRYFMDDLAHKTRLNDMTRHFMPFFGSLQGGFTSWIRTFIENPTALGRYRIALNTPEDAGLVTDEKGNHINADGTATNAKGEAVKGGKQRYITMPHLPGIPAGLEPKFNKKFLNTIGDYPSASPWVQVAAQELLNTYPNLESNLGFIFPYGPSQHLYDPFLPSSIKSVKTYIEQDGSKDWLKTFQSISATEQTNKALGKRADDPTYAEVKDKTNKVMAIKIASALVSPAGSPTFNSPYQLQIDAYKQAEQRYTADPHALKDGSGVDRTPTDWFIDTYGKEYFALTQGVVKNNGGIPSTSEGQKSAEKHSTLINKYPEIGSFIVGDEGAGAYNKSVYNAQFGQSVSPGSGTKRMEYLSPQDIIEGPNRRLGWDEYSKVNDLIEAERIRRGLPNLNVKGATDLRNLKKQLVGDPLNPELSDPNSLVNKYPEWLKDYTNKDQGKADRELQGFRAVVADPSMQGRPEIQGLKTYLSDRDLIVAELTKRKTKTLSETGPNADLYNIWESMKGDLITQNLPFSHTYTRWLDRDVLKGGTP